MTVPRTSLLLLLFALLPLVSLPTAHAQSGLGVDVSSLPTSSFFSCFLSSGYTSFIMRGFRSSGSVDSNVVSALQLANAAGVPHIDVYMFPDPLSSTLTAAQQFSALVSALSGSTYDIIWFDIEEDSAGQYWSTTYATNQAFYASLLSSCQTAGKRCGVYSNYNNWVTIFGSSTYQASGGSSLPLW